MKTAPSLSKSPLPLLSAPFVVSITGHRDPVETDVLSEKFERELEHLRVAEGVEASNCLLLSSLAEGADTLAAHVALRRLHWQVIAPLPLPVEEYRRDFEGDALDTFNQLLDECPHFFIGYALGCDADNTREHGAFRNRQYAFVGEFLTRHCEVLVAFWDGNPTRPGQPGGTPDVVTMQQQGIPTHLLELRRDGSLLDDPESGRVIHIWTSRKRHATNGERLPESIRHGQVAPVAPQASGQTDKHRASRRQSWEQFVASLPAKIPADSYGALPLELAPEGSYGFLARAACLSADALAMKLQGEVDVWFNRLTIIALAFTLCVAGAGAWGDQRWSVWPLVCSWALLLSTRAIAVWEKSSGHATRHQDYRALAEAWRIGFFWRAVGIEDPLDACYLRYQRGELDWIRQALRTADLMWLPAHPFPSATARDFEQTFGKWIESQTDYFDKKVPAGRVHLTSLRNWSCAFLVLGLCASAVATLAGLRSEASAPGSGVVSHLWAFATSFVSADLLSSPFVPAVLLVFRMRSWPIATQQNTADMRGHTKAETSKRHQLRHWFVLQSAVWSFVGIAALLLLLLVFSTIYVGLLPATQLVPFLQMTATVCFFLPALIFVRADFQALPEHVQSYERAFKIFERAKKMLQEIAAVPGSTQLKWDNPQVQAKARRIYRELGREALHENGEWLLIHRERPLDIEA